MTIPSQRYIELPLLLELERGGGRVRIDATLYDRMAAHFPGLTPTERQLPRQSSTGRVWDNIVDFARFSLRNKGELNGGQRGIWEITAAGKQRLRRDLMELGLSQAEVEEFMRSTLTIPQKVGARWQPEPRRFLGRQPPVAARVAPQPAASLPVSPVPSERPQPVAVGEATADRLLARVRNLSATQFEHLVGRFMEAMGLRDVRVTGRSYDGGIDGEGVVPFLNVKVGFQAKNWQNNVQGDRVRALIGSMQTRGYDRGVLVTTSAFSAGALEDAQGVQGRVILIDGQSLATKMIEKRLGIKDVIVRAEIDEAFFQQLGP